MFAKSFSSSLVRNFSSSKFLRQMCTVVKKQQTQQQESLNLNVADELFATKTEQDQQPQQKQQHNRTRAVRKKPEWKNLPSNADIIGEKVPLLPTFNLAAYVNESQTLQRFLELGVDLHQIERRKGLAQFLLQLQFNEDVQHKLLFLQDQGIPADRLGNWLTKNPLIFKEDLQTLQMRVDYLTLRKFNNEQRTRIIVQNPWWLLFSTQRIERRLGYFQREYTLRSQQVRELAAKQPRIITYNLQHLREATFCVHEEMGFNAAEMRQLLLSKPRLFLMTPNILVERFAFAHNEMKLSHQMVLEFPEVLCSREFRLRERHNFLKLIGRAQYDPKRDLYVSPADIVKGNDSYFCRQIAQCSLQTYEDFLRTT